MKDKIILKLKEIEKDENVKILFAVESGSRAWGFPSKDSDYDVRFVYVRPLEWYLSIDDKREVLEYPIDDLLDISGWDLKKALSLFRKSNPSLIEWLKSPIIYLDQYSFMEKLINLSKEYYSLKASIYHYLNMASFNYKKHLQGSTVNTKKYFYVLRPILACSWIEDKKTLPPVEFDKLLDSQVDDQELYSRIAELLKRKKSGVELDVEERIYSIHNYLEEQFVYYKNYVKDLEDGERLELLILDGLFRDTIKECWDVDLH